MSGGKNWWSSVTTTVTAKLADVSAVAGEVWTEIANVVAPQDESAAAQQGASNGRAVSGRPQGPFLSDFSLVMLGCASDSEKVTQEIVITISPHLCPFLSRCPRRCRPTAPAEAVDTSLAVHMTLTMVSVRAPAGHPTTVAHMAKATEANKRSLSATAAAAVAAAAHLLPAHPMATALSRPPHTIKASRDISSSNNSRLGSSR